MTTETKLTRTHTGIFAGVAEGMASYFKMDTVAMRLLWVLGFLLSGGTAVIIYFLMALIVPLEK